MRAVTSPVHPSKSAIVNTETLITAKQQVLTRSFQRETLATILTGYNRAINSDHAAMQQIEKLKLPGSVCVVTGQQLGILGGPAYAILKGISCLLTARQADAVPIYWLATEDHDIGEIDHTYLVDAQGNLERFHLSLPKNGHAAEDLLLSQNNVDQLRTLWQAVELPIDTAPSAGDSYTQSMARMLARLFAGTGMVFVEPKLLRPLAVPFFMKEITESSAIQQVLIDTSRKLEASGKTVPLTFTEGTNLFVKDEQGHRVRLRLEGNLYSAGSHSLTQKELLELATRNPLSFSTNVASRPVLQSSVLPVIAYLAGPSEAEYYQQLTNYHQFHGVPMPLIVPRLSATLISPMVAEYLQTCQLEPWQDFPLQEKGKELHLLRNWLHPHNKLQERVLNWWGFQAKSQENLVASCLKIFASNPDSHQYLYYS